jgi:transposase
VEAGQDLAAELAARDARIAGQAELITAQADRLAAQEEVIAELRAQVATLTKQLSRNSTNSHLPPSSDGPGGGSRVGRRKKKPSGRKRGGQKGHKGAHRRLLPPEMVDTCHVLTPSHCAGCAGSVVPVAGQVRRFQQVDIRDGKRHIEEWKLHDGYCPRCGTRTRRPFGEAAVPASAFGPGLAAVVVVLTGVYHLSRRQAQNALLDLFGISISLGSVSHLEGRASDALEPAYEEARATVEEALVKHTDATSWLRAGVMMSLWVLACSSATIYAILHDGKTATIRPLFGALKGILVSDRASVFGFWVMKERQVCWSHLIRRFVAFSQRDGPEAGIGAELLGLASILFEYWHGFRQGKLTRGELRIWMEPVQRHVEALLQRAAAGDYPEVSGSCRDILGHSEALWTFVEHEGVEPTNNHAELTLRPFVLWRKRSFGTQSERGERFAERIMTVAQTAREQGINVLDFLVRTLRAHVEGAAGPQLLAG